MRLAQILVFPENIPAKSPADIVSAKALFTCVLMLPESPAHAFVSTADPASENVRIDSGVVSA